MTRSSRIGKRARVEQVVAEPEPEVAEEPDLDTESDCDENEVLSALDTTDDEKDDEEWGSSKDQRPSSSSSRPVADFNAPVISVPYDGAMDEDELQTRLATPLDLGPVTLSEDQLKLVKRAVEALESTFKVYTNRSSPGSGKTLTTYAIAKMLGLKVVVVRPKRVSSWREEAKRCGFELHTELGYEGLRSIRGNPQPRHGLLNREDPPRVLNKKRKRKGSSSSSEEEDEDSEVEEVDGEDPMDPDYQEPEKSKVTTSKKKGSSKWIYPPPIFTATQKFLDLLKEPILLVLDESHRGKTRSERTSAISALVNAIVTTPGHRSRCIMLSATQFDDKAHVLSVCQTMGLIPAARGPVGKDSPLVVLGKAFAPEHRLMERRVIKGFDRTQKERNKFVYRVYIYIISPRISSAMPKQEMPVFLDAKIGFYNLPKEDEHEVRMAMYSYRQAKEQGGYYPSRLADMSKAVQRTQVAKVKTVARLVRNVFQENPTAAVTVMGMTLEALDDIAYELKDLFKWTKEELKHDTFVAARHVLSGRISAERQETTIKEFMDGGCSLLVANLEVGGEGLNLQDRKGDRQRWVFMLPSNHATSMVQGLSRFYRMDTKSDVVVRLVYCRSLNRHGEDVMREKALLENHKKKDQVWRDLMPEQDQQGAEFLAKMEVFFEQEDTE